MNSLVTLTQHPIAAILLQWTVLLGLCWLAHFALRKRDARWRVILWRNALCFALVLPVAQALPLPAVEVPVEPRISRIATESDIAPPRETTRAETAASAPHPLASERRAEGPPPPTASAPDDQRASGPLPWATLLLALWALGFAAGAARLIRLQVRLSQIRKRSVPAPSVTVDVARGMADPLGVGRAVEVRVSESIHSPFVCGIFNPMILVPRQLLHRLSPAQTASLLAHEIAHIARRDLMWCVAWRWMQAVCWFHPLVWKIPSAHNLACELEADRIAASRLDDRHSYAQALAQLTLRLVSPPAVETGLTVNGTSQIVRRLNYLGRQGFGAWKRRHTVVAVGLMGTFLLAAAGFQFTSASEPESVRSNGEGDRNGVISIQDAMGETIAETQGDFSGVAETIERLFEHGDADAFAREIAPSMEDWQGATPLEPSEMGDDEWFEGHLQREEERVARFARLLLDSAAEAGFDPAELTFSRVVEPVEYRAMLTRLLDGTAYDAERHDGSMADVRWIPFVPSLRMVFVREGGDLETGEEFEVTAYELLEFSGGWRIQEALLWSRMPEGIMTAEMRRTFALLNALEQRIPVEASVEPTLDDFGLNVLAVLRDGNAKARERLFWSEEEIQEKTDEMIRTHAAAGLEAPPMDLIEESVNQWRAALYESLDAASDRLERIGVDFARNEPEIERVEADLMGQARTDLAPDEMGANEIRITFSLPPGSEFAGRPIDGRYVLATGSAERASDRWIVDSTFRWERLPGHLLSEEELAGIEFENYVARQRVLPPGTPAPDPEFVSIDDESRVSLTDLSGQVVILEFWASWCGPCQKPMAELQDLVRNHPEWEGRVAVIALSIDDELEEAREHLERNGWKQTLNLWAGAGGFRSDAAEAFRVSAIPRAVVIDTEGVIRYSGGGSAQVLARVAAPLLTE